MRTNFLDKTPLTPGVCEWCGKICEEEDAACSLTCEAQLSRLEAAQGKIVLRVLKRWRKHRGRKGSPGEGAMTEAAAIIDRFLRNDRERREYYGAERRQKAAQEAAQEAEKAAQEAPKAGDLDPGVPNSDDPSKRGFQPN